MWFKHLQVCQFNQPIPYQPENLANELSHHGFKPCSAIVPVSAGFVAPFGDDPDQLVYGHNGYMLICLKIQEKVLPPAVLREQHHEKIKSLEDKLGKRISRDERQRIKDELQHTLLSKAFSKSSLVYAYVDTHHSRLVIDTCNKRKLERFYKLANLTLSQYNLSPYNIKSPSGILTDWLLNQYHPDAFSILDRATLEDSNEQKGKVSFSRKDLLADCVQSLLQEGSRVTQLSLNWDEKLHFTLKQDFSITSVKFLETIKDLAKDGLQETAADRFASDFFIMTETLSAFFADFMPEFIEHEQEQLEGCPA